MLLCCGALVCCGELNQPYSVAFGQAYPCEGLSVHAQTGSTNRHIELCRALVLESRKPNACCCLLLVLCRYKT
jgi:hypothetical protein